MNQAHNQVQKHFQVHSIYKRSKQYLDIEKMNEQEHFEQIIRRKPNKSIQTIDTRLDSSFQNSIEAANDKLNRQVLIHKQRYYETQLNPEDYEQYFNADLHETQNSRLRGKDRKSRYRGSDWDKMLPRLMRWQKKSPYKNEDQFNNYDNSSKSPRHLNNSLLDFNIATSRQYINRSKSPKSFYNQNSQTNPLKVASQMEKNKFNNSVYKCVFDYSKTDSKKHSQKKYHYKQVQPKPIPQQRLNKSLQKVTKNSFPVIGQFYHTVSQQVPSQMNMRYNNQQTFFFENKSKRAEKQGYDQKKNREVMKNQRRNNILNKKKVQIDKSEMCDNRYFFLLKQKMNKKQ